jgi:hydrogenase maturation protease
VNLDQVEKIAEAVLYEGYMLYPYRPSSVKNQQRWNFGVLYPPFYCQAQTGSEASTMQTECLLRATSSTRLTIKVRFLQIVRRSIGRLCTEGKREPEGVEPEAVFVDRLVVAGHVYMPWQEAIEREKTFLALDLEGLTSTCPVFFAFPGGKSFEYLLDERGLATGVVAREWRDLNGSVQLDAESLRDDVMKITVRVKNDSHIYPQEGTAAGGREAALCYSLVSAHTILGVEDAKFLSLLEFPQDFADLAAKCNNVGTWPVLVGDRADTMLSSPIILYDNPQIAHESTGNLFDSTEIDEILSLRILTLTDDEKREMRESDERSREILERTENMPPEQFMKLHGVLRSLTPIEGGK